MPMAEILAFCPELSDSLSSNISDIWHIHSGNSNPATCVISQISAPISSIFNTSSHASLTILIVITVSIILVENSKMIFYLNEAIGGGRHPKAYFD